MHRIASHGLSHRIQPQRQLAHNQRVSFLKQVPLTAHKQVDEAADHLSDSSNGEPIPDPEPDSDSLADVRAGRPVGRSCSPVMCCAVP